MSSTEPIRISNSLRERSVVDFQINITAVERILKRTPLVGAGEYRCPTTHPQFLGGGPEKCPFIVFSHSSVRLIPSRGKAEVCTPNTVNLLDVGDSYERLPVSAEGAICDWIAIAPALLRDIAIEVNPEVGNNSERVFECAVVPLASSVFLSQRLFFNAIRRNPHITRLALEDAAIQLTASVLNNTVEHSRKQQHCRTFRVHRHTSTRRREMVEEAKCILAREYCDDIGLTQLAERVHCSPGYLSRSFSDLTGYTLHSYQTQIRLRVALQLIAEARFNGAGIAPQLGFASHSHLSSVFGKHFGITPSAFARCCSKALLERMSGHSRFPREAAEILQLPAMS